ncbi:MAG: outer membrane lipoprotein chaperone LolA [Gammaproteobacteria bacterium]|nr:outer membrane lipoprotein chaperone LolA [Gammaproteobacteria bacterium]
MMRVTLFALLYLLILPAWSATGVEQMQQFLQNLDKFQANFKQSLLDIELTENTTSEGTFYLERPHHFRWNYEGAEGQQIIADGRQIWLYEPDLEQVSVKSQKSALQGTPGMLLVGDDPVDMHFTVVERGGGSGSDLAWVELIPKSNESQYSSIMLAFSDSQLQQIEMLDQFGGATLISFSDIDTNPEFESGLFTFERPDRLDIYSN